MCANSLVTVNSVSRRMANAAFSASAQSTETEAEVREAKARVRGAEREDVRE